MAVTMVAQAGMTARPGGSGATPLAFAGTKPYW